MADLSHDVGNLSPCREHHRDIRPPPCVRGHLGRQPWEAASGTTVVRPLHSWPEHASVDVVLVAAAAGPRRKERTARGRVRERGMPGEDGLDAARKAKFMPD